MLITSHNVFFVITAVTAIIGRSNLQTDAL